MTSVIPGRIVSRRATLEQIVALSTDKKHLLDEQHQHFRRMLQKKKRLYGVLQGRQQEFTVALIEDEKRTVLLDGYLRGNALAAGDVILDKDFPLYLRTHFVKSREEANVLFEQYNQLSADKRVETALREAGKFKAVKSGLLLSRGRASAIQFAAGMKSSRDVKDATLQLLPAILKVEALGLNRASHEFAGCLGAYLAVCRFVPEFATGTALEFVKAANKGVPLKARTAAKAEVDAYTHWLLTTPVRTGAGANKEAFERGLFAATAYIFKRNRKKLPKVFEDRYQLTYGEFLAVMSGLKVQVKKPGMDPYAVAAQANSKKSA